MVGSVNKVTLVGNLGRDPEVRYSQDGAAIVSLSLATSEHWKDRSTGERREKTEWHRVVVFNENLAKVIQNYLKKGSKVYIEGQLQTRKWTDQSGIEKYTTEVVLQRYRGELVILDGRDGGNKGDGYQQNSDGADVGSPSESFNHQGGSGISSEIANLDDDIPF